MKFQIILVVLGKANFISAFLFESHCAAPKPCVCRQNYIRCEEKQLAQIPNLTEHYGHSDFLYVYFYNNELRSIPQNAFTSLSSINATRVDMQLDHNFISKIDSTAFEGIESAMWELNLQDNNFTELPIVLGDLTSLRRLNVLDNPITSLNATLMSRLGHSLVKLSISVEGFSDFPEELQFLKGLTFLTITISLFRD